MQLKPEYIIIHHTGTFDSKSLSWGVIRNNHKNLNYDDIGYHFGIEYVRSGYEILMGRMPNVVGAHCRTQGMNRKSLGVCLTGNFDITKPPRELLLKAYELVPYLMSQFDIPKEKVVGHRDIKQTTLCPGRFFDLARFKSKL